VNKVLILCNKGGEYNEFMLVHGFRELLGAANVICYPFRNSFYKHVDIYPDRYVGDKCYLGEGFTELWNDPKLWRLWEPQRSTAHVPLAFSHPESISVPMIDLPRWGFDDVLSAIRSGEIRLVILSSPRWFNSSALHELMTRLGKQMPPFVMVDGEDYPQLRWDFIDKLRPTVYFKRTFLREVTPDMHVVPSLKGLTPLVPLPLSSMWKLPYKPWKDRSIDVLCMFRATHKLRGAILEIVNSLCHNKTGLRYRTELGGEVDHEEYMRLLSEAKVVIDHQPVGTDTVRTWETFSCGSCLVSDLHIAMEEPFLPDQHFIKVPFEEDDLENVRWGHDTKLNIPKKLHNYETVIKRVLEDVDALEPLGLAAHTLLQQHHTTSARAKTVIRNAMQHGIEVGTLSQVLA